MPFHQLIGFMFEALAILVAAKLVRDAVLKRRGYDVNELVARKQSVGAATSQAGYLVGVLLGFLGAVSVRAENLGFLGVVGFLALSGMVAIVLQLAADIASDRFIFRGLDGVKGTGEDVNLALGVGKAAVSIATGLVLRGAMSDPETQLLGRIAWFGVAQALMVIAVLAYCRITTYDDLAEIKRNNVAAGFPIAGILLAVGLVMEAAVSGRSSGSISQAVLDTGKFVGLSLLLVYVFRLITGFILLPKVDLSRAIVQDRSVAAGIQEGVSFVLASLLVTFFLS